MRLALLIACLFLISAKQPVTPEGLDTFTVLEVVDGDTLKIDFHGEEEKVRVIGLDTPELHHPNKPVQAYALAAKDFVEDLIADSPVALEADGKKLKRDRYGRLLAHVWIEDKCLAAEVIGCGYGFCLVKYPFRQEYMEWFEALQTEAREEKRGLWR